MAGETASGSFDFPSVAYAPSGSLRKTGVEGDLNAALKKPLFHQGAKQTRHPALRRVSLFSFAEATRYGGPKGVRASGLHDGGKKYLLDNEKDRRFFTAEGGCATRFSRTRKLYVNICEIIVDIY
jgi:hypothetical protein